MKTLTMKLDRWFDTMGMKRTLIFFGVPSILITVSFTWLYPYLIGVGMIEYWATFLCIWGILVLMTSTVLVMWKTSGRTFGDYFWVKKPRVKMVLISLGAFVLVQGLELITAPTRNLLIRLPGFGVPDVFPTAFSPELELTIPMEQWMGLELKGQWLPFVLWALWLVLNIFTEELLWRGFALKRMEKHFGKYAWVVNGLCWNIGIHFMMRWTFISLLPVSLLVPYLCQKYKSWIPGVIIHGVGNALAFVVMALSY